MVPSSQGFLKRGVTGMAERWHNLHGVRENSVNLKGVCPPPSGNGHRRDTLFQLFDAQLDGVRFFSGGLTDLFLLLRGEADSESVAAGHRNLLGSVLKSEYNLMAYRERIVKTLLPVQGFLSRL